MITLRHVIWFSNGCVYTRLFYINFAYQVPNHALVFPVDRWIWWKCKWMYKKGFQYNGSQSNDFFKSPSTHIIFHEDNETYSNYSTKGSGKIGWKQISFLLTFKDEKI